MVSNRLHSDDIGFWARDMAGSTDTNNLFSNALLISYSHLSVVWKVQMLISMFGEFEEISYNCCDVCQMEVASLHERREEFRFMQSTSQAKWEVEVTDWTWGGQIVWMESANNEFAHRKSPIEWWRSFIHQCSAAGYISCYKACFIWKHNTGILCQPTKGQKYSNHSVLLPNIYRRCNSENAIEQQRAIMSGELAFQTNRESILPFLKQLLKKKENWRDITTENK